MKLYKKWHCLFIIICLFMLICFLSYLYFNNYSVKTITFNKTNIDTPTPYKECLNRLNSLEPKIPINLTPTPRYPSNIKPISEVIKSGKEIPLQLAYNDLKWQRPIYKTYWHTTPTGGRWSYVPVRIDYSLHRIFTAVPTGSIYYDFIHNLGIAEESKNFDFDSTNIDQIVMVIMNSNIKKIVILENQIAVIVEPMRTGLQTLIIPKSLIQPSSKDDIIIFHMVTPDGYEIDYSLF